MTSAKSMNRMANTFGTMLPGTIVPIRLEPYGEQRYRRGKGLGASMNLARPLGSAIGACLVVFASQRIALAAAHHQLESCIFTVGAERWCPIESLGMSFLLSASMIALVAGFAGVISLASGGPTARGERMARVCMADLQARWRAHWQRGHADLAVALATFLPGIVQRVRSQYAEICPSDVDTLRLIILAVERSGTHGRRDLQAALEAIGNPTEWPTRVKSMMP